jgi:DNA-binding GntR family transcriptional regulator
MLQQQSLVAMADQEIRQLIVTGELAPGDRLFEARLSERLGISRPPLREALRILAAAQILEQTPRHGYRVVKLSPHDMEEIYGLRHVLEEYALSLILPTLRNPDLDGLTQIMARMWQAAHAGGEAGVIEANREFHLTLVGLARHSRLAHTYQRLMDQMQLCMAANLRSEARSLGDLFEGCRRHDRLLDSLRTRDPERIRTALREHGERSYLPSAESGTNTAAS